MRLKRDEKWWRGGGETEKGGKVGSDEGGGERTRETIFTMDIRCVIFTIDRMFRGSTGQQAAGGRRPCADSEDNQELGQRHH